MVKATGSRPVERVFRSFAARPALLDGRGPGRAHDGAYGRELAGMARELVHEWRVVLTGKTLTADILAGITVAAVALPLNLALAVASGMPPAAGIVAGALGGVMAAAFGGTRLQVTGPAAALTVLVFAIAKDFGPSGVAAACLMIAGIQLALSFSTAGKLSQHFPESVLAGFTTGVGIKLLDSQLPEILGFDYKVYELAQMMHRPRWLHEVSWTAVVCGLFVAFAVTTTAKYKRFPSAIVAIAAITFVSMYDRWNLSRIGVLPSSPFQPSWPMVAEDRWFDLFLAAALLGLLASVESLLSARALDRMSASDKPHNSNLELFGQGLANLTVGFFGGMPVSGVVVRSGVNFQSGGRTRLAAALHGVLLGLAVVYLAAQLTHVPLAALAGLLCVVGVRLIELHTLRELLGTHRLEAAAFVVTAAGTVTGHLMLGLVAGGLLHGIHRFVHRHELSEDAQSGAREPGIRAVLDQRHHDEARRPAHFGPGPEHVSKWIRHLEIKTRRARSAFVHEKAAVIGDVLLGDHVHVAAGSSIRADEGTPFFLGDNTNVQDGVVIHALKDKHVLVGTESWAVYVGRNVSIAHDALVHGPCYIGDDTFIGFKAVVHDSIVGRRCYIGIGAVVVGVEIPDGIRVPHGAIVDSADAVHGLPPAEDVHHEFNEDVVEVNRGLAAAYHAVGRHPPTRGSGLRGELVREDQTSSPHAPKPWDEAWEAVEHGSEVF